MMSLVTLRVQAEVAKALMFVENFSEPLSRAAIVLRADGLERATNGNPVSGPDPLQALCLDWKHALPAYIASMPKCCQLKGYKGRTTFWCVKCTATSASRKARTASCSTMPKNEEFLVWKLTYSSDIFVCYQ
jgi:hypothetical protein